MAPMFRTWEDAQKLGWSKEKWDAYQALASGRTAEVLAHANRLAAVGCFCIGTNQVDLHAARARGIAVFNAPYSNTRSVAELVLAEAILLLRGVPAKSAAAHRGDWLKTAENAFEIRGKTLGIVGYGAIGSQLSVLAEALGMQVVFVDLLSKLPLGNARQVGTMDELWEAVSWAQLGYHAKPVGLLNALGFFDHLIAFNHHMIEVGFIREAHQGIIIAEPELDLLLARMAAHQPHTPIFGMKTSEL